jgi:RNA processing factor Prp31
VNMTEKEIREAVKNKENYSSIVTYFKTQKTLSEADLALLIDIIEEMSPEIYEHYRALQDMFREGIRKHLEASKEASGEQLAYAIKKGCALGTLLAEKYADRV